MKKKIYPILSMGPILLPLIIILAGMLALSGCTRFRYKEVHLIPEGFRGVVMIIFEQKSAPPAGRQGGSTVYCIPAHGVLKVSSAYEEGWRTIHYFYEGPGGSEEIPYCWDRDTVNPDHVYVWRGSYGTYGNGDQEINCLTYTVATLRELDSLSRLAEKISPWDYMDE